MIIARLATLSFTISWSLLRIVSIELVMPSNFSHPCTQSFQHQSLFSMNQLFALGGQNIGFSFNISPSNE